MQARFYATDSGRSQPREFLLELPVRERMEIEADIAAYVQYGDHAALSRKPIKGHSPMWEIRTFGFRTLFFCQNQTMWILHICKKQDQRRGIETASRRMKELQS